MPEILALTGASGFLGSAFRSAAPTETTVMTLGRTGCDMAWDMRSSSSPDLGAADAVVHCAWMVTPRDAATASANIASSAALLDAARSRSARFVFISSMSANSATKSRYGQSKFEVERAVLSYEHGLVIRPGTIQSVAGSLGMLDETLDRIAGLALGIRLRPDPLVPLVSLDRVVAAIWADVEETDLARSVVTLVDEWVPLGVLIGARRRKAPRMSVPLPSALVGLGARLGRSLPLSGVRDPSDSWLGLADAARNG